MKIIAIRLLKGCNPKYIKLLDDTETYQLYNDFTIGKDDSISEECSLPEKFFSTGKQEINISAVVGKNGSGKSTLIELLFKALNNVACTYEKVRIAKLKYVDNLRIDIFYKTDTFYKLRVYDKEISFFKYDDTTKKIADPITDFELKNFLYTIAVNYSLYAYNVNELAPEEGRWIEGVFHKNDGYRTPLVLNPYRDEGMIDINTENHLTNSRLIANLLLPIKKGNANFRVLTDSLTAYSLNLTIASSKSDFVFYTLESKDKKKPEEVTINNLNIAKDKLLKEVAKLYKFGYTKLDKSKYEIALDYIVYKVVSIAIKYYNPVSIVFIEKEKGFIELTSFLKDLFTDKSHVTLKLRQTINYLKFQHIALEDQEITLERLSSKNSEILARRTRFLDAEELVPPPIFQTEIIMKGKANQKPILFKTLSSGEKQMIYSVSSFLYHLSNIASISLKSKTRIAYSYINIVLEEIELYAHPEMQRRYIKYILECIKGIKLKRQIPGINICIVTHSPFILSDIPTNNILFLNEKGKPEKSLETLKTFGGNIHDLLTHSFFLDKGSIGAFAMEKIDWIIKQLIKSKTTKISPYEKENLWKYIQLIGEPFLQNKLLDMYYENFDKEKRIAELKEELKKLEQ